MSGSVLDGGGFGGLGGLFEKMPFMDAITVLILGFDAYMLYAQMDVYDRGSLTSISSDPYALAIQTSVVLILIYSLEFLHDKKGSDHR